jgi:hypothetical protein
MKWWRWEVKKVLWFPHQNTARASVHVLPESSPEHGPWRIFQQEEEELYPRIHSTYIESQ